MNYVSTTKRRNKNNVVIENIFTYTGTNEIMQQYENLELDFVDKCRQKND